MAKEDDKKRSGLHKDISSIFDGVPIPSDRSRPTGPQQGQQGYESPRPPAHAPQNPQIPQSYQRPGIPTEAQGTLHQAAKKFFAPKPGVGPARQKIMLILVPILLVVFVVMLGKVVDIPFLTAKKPATPKIEDVSPPIMVSSDIDWRKPDLYPEGLRDPMQLTAAMARLIRIESQPPPELPKVGPLTVKGIVYSKDNPTAVIGTKIAHIGDIIEGARVIKINPDSVEFEKDGETFTKTVEP